VRRAQRHKALSEDKGGITGDSGAARSSEAHRALLEDRVVRREVRGGDRPVVDFEWLRPL
jgi:hypothetical protein